ncbi:hypothetical protein [Neobacillus vireti]|uniref:hypothetical protein n=1 Tax=Neobacillus vireti TaxID=220686 RepID=UPI002FFE4D4C
MKVTDIQKAKKIYADENGIVLEINDEKIHLFWGVIDEIAEVSEEHYHEQTVEVFKALISQKNVN